MEKKNVNCPFCGYEKQIGADCPKCGRGGVIFEGRGRSRRLSLPQAAV